jgi:hypothetical protein
VVLRQPFELIAEITLLAQLVGHGKDAAVLIGLVRCP